MGKTRRFYTKFFNICILFMVLIGFLYVVIWQFFPSQHVSLEEVWPVVVKSGHENGIMPGFIFAIIMAESSLNPQAATASSRGLMQLSQLAWETVSTKPFDDAWIWQDNIQVGSRYLAHCKMILDDHAVFSYPRLAACYHLGPNALKACRWQMACLPKPQNTIYRKLYQGDLHPVKLPE